MICNQNSIVFLTGKCRIFSKLNTTIYTYVGSIDTSLNPETAYRLRIMVQIFIIREFVYTYAIRIPYH